MKITQDDHALRIIGVRELDAANARAFHESVNATITDAVKIVEIDLSESLFLDSCGLGALMALWKMMARRGGTVRLVNPPLAALQLLELTRLHRILEIVQTEEIPAR